MLTLAYSPEAGRLPGSPYSPPHRRAGDRSPPLATGKPGVPQVVYQSEHVVWDPTPPGFPPYGGDAGALGAPIGHPTGALEGSDAWKRQSSLGAEGVVHFSVPARVSGGRGSGSAGDWSQGGDDAAGVTYTAELWQIVNRVRRVSRR